MNWATQEETVACCQEEGFLQKGDVVSTITGEYSTMTYCFEHKGKSYVLTAGMHFTYADESEVFMFVPEQNQIKAVGIEVSRSLNSTPIVSNPHHHGIGQAHNIDHSFHQ